MLYHNIMINIQGIIKKVCKKINDIMENIMRVE